jgi:ABC-2 type transport system permease protein
MTVIDVAGTEMSPATQYRTVGFANLLRSEWTKQRSLRSTYLCVAFTVLAMVGIALLMGIRWSRQSGPMPPNFDAANVTLSGAYLAQVVVGALGVLAISSEYATGMIRATFAAVPQRRALLAAKALVLAASVLALGEVLAFASFGIGQALLSDKHVGVSLGDSGVLQAVFGTGLYVAVAALLGFGLGAAIRHTAGAISAFFGLMFAATAVVNLLPESWRNAIVDYLPLNAGGQILTTVRVKGGLAPWTGLGVFALYALAALVIGFLVVGARDA